MKYYNVELDGLSLVRSDIDLTEYPNSIVEIKHNGETAIYRLREVDHNNNLKLSLVKFLRPTEHETPFVYDVSGVDFYFLNRLSKNQTISIGSRYFKVLEIKGAVLVLEHTYVMPLTALYPVYPSGTKRRLEDASFLFADWGEAIIYIAKQRELGYKTSF